MAKSKNTILVVDDEESNLKAVKDILRHAGYKIICVESGSQALMMMKNLKPDLILLDHFMPRMTGKMLCAKIRADPELKDIKIVFVTVARFSKEELGDLERMNVLDYIPKPFEVKDLLFRVKKAIER